jgi:uncharacterized membrane protein HdeD (DUF308 family)
MTKQLLILRKWWAILLQGIVLVLFSLFVFKYPEGVLVTLSLWLGILVLAAGLTGILVWKAGEKPEREYLPLVLSILVFTMGILMIIFASTTLKILTVVFGLWCLVTGIMLIKHGWSLKANSSMGLVLVIVGVLSVVGALFVIFNVSVGAAVIGFYLGLQVLITGISLILLSVAKKMISVQSK